MIWRLCSIVALVFAIGCGTPTTHNAGPMEIELDVFSGRPNPRWLASPEHAASVSAALSSLPAAPDQPEPGHLGYRGFVVRQQGLSARVYGGRVIVTANGTTRTFVDSTGLEKQLTDDASARGFGDIVKQ